MIEKNRFTHVRLVKNHHIPFEMNPKLKKYCLFRCCSNCLQTELNQATDPTSLFLLLKIYVNPNRTGLGLSESDRKRD